MAVSLSNFTPESILQKLRANGMRATKGRRAIIEVLFEAEKPLSLQEIQDAAGGKTEDRPDYATVFRMMVLLEQLRLVHKVNMQKSCSYFELQDPDKHYDHLICRECGKVVVIDMPCPLREAEQMITERYGFRRLTHSLDFFGCCPECSIA